MSSTACRQAGCRQFGAGEAHTRDLLRIALICSIAAQISVAAGLIHCAASLPTTC